MALPKLVSGIIVCRSHIVQETKAMHSSYFIGAIAALALVGQGLGQPQVIDHNPGQPVAFPPAQIKWGKGPPSLPAGAQLAVLDGDPTKEGQFVMRIKMPDGYRVAPHVHPKQERLTVISGTLHVGMGEKFDPKMAFALPTGSFGTWPAGMKHFGWTEGETVIQLHGIGPWEVHYLNPADDPRNAKK
jgi:hypothetical protein